MFGFKHGGVIYLSDSVSKLERKVEEIRANIYMGEPLPPGRFVSRVDPEALKILALDYKVRNLDAEPSNV